MKKIILGLMIILFLTGCQGSGGDIVLEDKGEKMNRQQVAEEIVEYIKQEMKSRKIVGLSLAVVDKQGVLLSEGFGFADKDKNLPANEKTLFPVASITKTLTAMAVIQLAEEGEIDLDKAIGDYIPELSLPNRAENIITTRMLLTHHSGLQGDILYNWYLPEVSENPLEYEKIVDLINKTGTVFPPAKMHSYCNTGYSLLGVLIHKVSGKNYVEYINSEIFDPMGINNSIVYAGEKTDAVIAKGYQGKQAVAMPMKMGIPAGGVAFSAEEAALYLNEVIDAYHGKSELLKEETMKEMMTAQNKNIAMDEGFSIGFSWFLQNTVGVDTKLASHRGELPPYDAMTMILPELEIGVMISQNTNKAATAPEEMTSEIIETLYKYHTGENIRKKESSPETILTRQQAKKLEGIYSSMYFGPMKVIAKGNKLLLKAEAMPMAVHLIPHQDNTFSMKVKLLGLIPLPIKRLEAITVEFREYDDEEYLYFNIANMMLNPNKKIEPFSIPDGYKKYAGNYKVTNMKNSDRIVKDVKIEMDKEGKFYILKYSFLERHDFNIAIRPVDESKARLAGEGYFVGEKLNWEEKNGKTLLYWSGLILEKK